MIFADLCRIKSFFSDIQRVEKQYFLARHFRRANFFVLFQKFFSETGCVSASQFQISEGIKNFLRFRVCIWLLPVGISEGVFWSKQNKAPATGKIIFSFFL